jgi:hypothetical protein
MGLDHMKPTTCVVFTINDDTILQHVKLKTKNEKTKKIVFLLDPTKKYKQKQ